MATSQNGYKAGDESLLTTFTIPGTDRKARLRKGAPGELLVAWAKWFHEHIEPIDKGQLDDWSYAYRAIRGQTEQLSNHSSGTAIDLNALKHPRGKRGTFTPGQVSRIDKELAGPFGGAIRWGEHYQHSPVDGMHFELAASPARCAEVLAKLKPDAPAKAGPPVNHVTLGRSYIERGIEELRKAPKSRTGVHSLANDEETRLNRKGTPKT
jgi:hypothetical protein